MLFRVETSENIPVLVLSGRFDAYEAPQVVVWIEKEINQACASAVVDLSMVNFVDSTALATLVKGMKRSREFGGDFVLCGLDQAVRVIFELTRLDKAFQIFNSRSEAVHALQG